MKICEYHFLYSVLSTLQFLKLMSLYLKLIQVLLLRIFIIMVYYVLTAEMIGNTITFNNCSREIKIRCSNATNKDCTIKYESNGLKEIKIRPGSTRSIQDARENQEFEIIILQGSVMLKHFVNYTKSGKHKHVFYGYTTLGN